MSKPDGRRSEVLPNESTDRLIARSSGVNIREPECCKAAPRSSSNLQNKSFVPERRRTHSTKAIELDNIRNVARGILSAGMSLSETRLFELVGCPRYRADILRAMRQLRNFYPGKLRLVLDHGEWYLIPVGSGEP